MKVKNKNKIKNEIIKFRNKKDIINKKNKINSINQKIMMILILILSFMNIFTMYSLGKYIYYSQKYKMISLVVAKPIFIVNSDKEIIYDKDMDTFKFEFNIKNYNDSEISDINLKYNIKFESNILNNMEIKLFRDNNKIEILNNKSEDLNLSNNKREEKNFSLECKVKNKDLINELSKLQIVIYAYQIN